MREGSTIGLNLVAMIDVVFLLLTYFLLTTNFTIGEEVYHLDLPSERTGGVDDPFSLPDQPLIITIASAAVGGRQLQISLDLPVDPPPSTIEELFRFLSDQQVRPDHAGGIFLPENPIYIRPTAGTRWEDAVNVFNACLRAEYTNVRFIDPA
ncbi:MAG: biopolymer transporter ExbD [Phycisphaerales bacterium]